MNLQFLFVPWCGMQLLDTNNNRTVVFYYIIVSPFFRDFFFSLLQTIAGKLLGCEFSSWADHKELD